MTSEEKIKAELLQKIDLMAKKIKQGKDIEITTCTSGLSIKEVDKKRI